MENCQRGVPSTNTRVVNPTDQFTVMQAVETLVVRPNSIE